ncbi:HugZ family protein [Aureimonas phyllosphaerae]|uniref:HugZ family pyridoxamine 5'-phosphate oxidase n=1 Tax=Aureimonas phyllosphaerae TaxID=1166078 RepID=UPI003A5BDFEA
MTPTPPLAPSPYLRADDEALALARRLLRTARHAALAWLDPETHAPMTSRVALATDVDGSPILLLSQLSVHTRALGADPRISLLVGETNEGDALNQPRLSLAGSAMGPIAGDADAYERLMRRFTAHHPSARLYGTFSDFSCWRVEIGSAFLNGGFARAYPLGRDDFLDAADADILAAETRVVNHMNEDHADVLDGIMARRGSADAGWRIATMDRRGFELVLASRVERVEFEEAVASAADFRSAFVALARALDE